MSPRARNAAVAVGLGAAVAAVGLWWFGRAYAKRRDTPPFGVADQPPEQITEPLTAAQSRAANGCVPMMGPCGMHTAGSRWLRSYPPTTAENPATLGLSFTFNGDTGTC